MSYDARRASALSEDDPDLKRIKHGNFLDDYTLLDELGTGAYSVVYECQHNATGKTYAAKVTEKVDDENTAMLMREISVLFKVDHPNIIKLHEVYENDSCLYMVLEIIKGQELFDRIVELQGYSESDAVKITRQLLNAIAYLHARGIVHRDIKPENLMVTKDPVTGEEMLKLLDFGFSRRVEHGQRMSTHVGTETYSPPELLTGQVYDNSVDMWSVGVTTYILLSGSPPFWTDHQTEALMKILTAKYDFDLPVWESVSDAAKDFIRNTIVANPKRRMTVVQALEHPWIKGSSSDTPKKQASVAALQKYQNERKRMNERNSAFMGEWKDELTKQIKRGSNDPDETSKSPAPKSIGMAPINDEDDDDAPESPKDKKTVSPRVNWGGGSRRNRQGPKGTAADRHSNYSPPAMIMAEDADNRSRGVSESSGITASAAVTAVVSPRQLEAAGAKTETSSGIVSPRSKVPLLQLKKGPAMQAIASSGMIKSASSDAIRAKPIAAIPALKSDAIPALNSNKISSSSAIPAAIPMSSNKISSIPAAIPAMKPLEPLPATWSPTKPSSSTSPREKPSATTSPREKAASLDKADKPEKPEKKMSSSPQIKPLNLAAATAPAPTPVPAAKEATTSSSTTSSASKSAAKLPPLNMAPNFADGSLSPRSRSLLEMPSLAMLSGGPPKSPRKAQMDTPEKAVKRMGHNMAKLTALVGEIELHPESAKTLGPLLDEFLAEFTKHAEKAGVKLKAKGEGGPDKGSIATAVKNEKKDKRNIQGSKKDPAKAAADQLAIKLQRMFTVLKMFDDSDADPDYTAIVKTVMDALKLTTIKQFFEFSEADLRAVPAIATLVDEIVAVLKWKKEFKLEKLQGIIETAKANSEKGPLDPTTEQELDKTQQDLTKAMTLIGLGVDLGCTSSQILAAKELWRSIE